MAPIFKQLHAEDGALAAVWNAMLQRSTPHLTASWSRLGSILPGLRTLLNAYNLTACGSQPLLK